MRRGFTLIELLVVIATSRSCRHPVPGLCPRGRRHARRVSATQAARVGGPTYAQDYDQRFHIYRVGTPGMLPICGITIQATSNQQIMQCPSCRQTKPNYGVNYHHGCNRLMSEMPERPRCLLTWRTTISWRAAHARL